MTAAMAELLDAIESRGLDTGRRRQMLLDLERLELRSSPTLAEHVFFLEVKARTIRRLSGRPATRPSSAPPASATSARNQFLAVQVGRRHVPEVPSPPQTRAGPTTLFRQGVESLLGGAHG